MNTKYFIDIEAMVDASLLSLKEYFRTNTNLKINQNYKKLEDLLRLFIFYLKEDREGIEAYLQDRKPFLKKHIQPKLSHYENKADIFIQANSLSEHKENSSHSHFFTVSKVLKKNIPLIFDLLEIFNLDKTMLEFPAPFYVFKEIEALFNFNEKLMENQTIQPEEMEKLITFGGNLTEHEIIEAEIKVAENIFTEIATTFWIKHENLLNRDSHGMTENTQSKLVFIMDYLNFPDKKNKWTHDKNRFSQYIQKLNSLSTEALKFCIEVKEIKSLFLGYFFEFYKVNLGGYLKSVEKNINVPEELILLILSNFIKRCKENRRKENIAICKEFAIILQLPHNYSLDKRNHNHIFSNYPLIYPLLLCHSPKKISEAFSDSQVRFKLEEANSFTYGIKENETAADALNDLIEYFINKLDNIRSTTQRKFGEFTQLVESEGHIYKIAFRKKDTFGKLAKKLNRFLPHQIADACQEKKEELNQLCQEWHQKLSSKSHYSWVNARIKETFNISGVPEEDNSDENTITVISTH